MENSPFIDALPIKNGDFPLLFVSLPEGNHQICGLHGCCGLDHPKPALFRSSKTCLKARPSSDEVRRPHVPQHKWWSYPSTAAVRIPFRDNQRSQ